MKQAKLTSFGPEDIDQLTSNFRIELDQKVLQEMVRSYARGDARARMETGKSVELGGTEAQAQLQTLAEYLKPIQDYNSKFADKLGDIVKESINSGSSPIQIKREIAQSTTKLMREPITIQREGKKAVTYTPETYADMLSTTIPYSLRNRAYVEHYKQMGVADGWISVIAEDEKACEYCMAKAAESLLKPFSWNDPLPAYHPWCRCRPQPHFPDDLPEDEEPGKDVTEEDKKAIMEKVEPQDIKLIPMTDTKEAISEIKKDFPVEVTSHMPAGTVARFYGPKDSPMIQIRPDLAKTGKAGAGTLVHEYMHGVDWGKDENHYTSNNIYQLQPLFPQLDSNQLITLNKTELKDSMSYVRFGVNFHDDRLSFRGTDDITTRTLRANGVPDQVDYTNLRNTYLARAEEAIESGRWEGAYLDYEKGTPKDFLDKKSPLEKFLFNTRALGESEVDQLKKKGTEAAKDDASKLYMANTLLPTTTDGKVLTQKSFSVINQATGKAEEIDEMITPYNVGKYLSGVEDPIKRHDIETGIVLRYLIDGEKAGSFTNNGPWAEKPTERLAEFARFIYVDPSRAKEIAPNMYKAFMENLVNGVYGDVLKKILGAVV